MKKEVYRHYGHSKFDKNKFIKISNQYYSNKPRGGLWSSPTKDYDVNWYEWCKAEEFCTYSLRKHFDFTLKDDARILVIKDIKDLDKLPRYNTEHKHEAFITDIDFKKLAEDYDALMVYIYRSSDLTDEEKLCDGIYYKLYGWDVDTLLVLNPEVVEVI